MPGYWISVVMTTVFCVKSIVTSADFQPHAIMNEHWAWETHVYHAELSSSRSRDYIKVRDWP